MELLIDIIIWIIKAAANSSSQRTPRPMNPQEADRQRALAAQLQALQQRAIGAAPRGTVAPGRKQAVKSINWGVPTPPRWVTSGPVAKAVPATLAKVAEAPAPAPARQAVPARPKRVPLRVPLIMGEILGPPLALRDPEF